MVGKRLLGYATTALLLILLSGCTDVPGTTSSASRSPSASASPSALPTTATALPTASPTPSRTPGPTPPAGMPSGAINYSVTDWAIPSGDPLELGSSLGQFPPALLESVDIGKHPEAKPPFERVSFRFREATPTCRLQYVKDFRGTDDKVVPVKGEAHLSVVFFTAQGPASGPAPVTGDGSPILQGLAKYDEFEGYLNYGLGLQLAPQSDQVRLARCGHLQYTDNRSAPYVVFVDVQADQSTGSA
jgi:hypothetical protein